MSLTSWRRRLSAGTGPISRAPIGDYTAYQRSRRHRVNALRTCWREWLDTTGAMLTIVAELLAWKLPQAVLCGYCGHTDGEHDGTGRCSTCNRLADSQHDVCWQFEDPLR